MRNFGRRRLWGGPRSADACVVREAWRLLPRQSVSAEYRSDKAGRSSTPGGSFAVDKHGAFRELGLKDVQFEGIGRVRQHVNPLSSSYRDSCRPPDWNSVFRDPKLPLVVDAGTGCGRFLLLAAKNDVTPVNYLGAEIRRPLVNRANAWARELGLDGRVHFLFANVTASLLRLLENYPGEVRGVYVQFPDPSFKKKRVKRHIVQREFVEACCRAVRPGGIVFLQSDVESCAVYMRDAFSLYGGDEFVPHRLHGVDFWDATRGRGREWDRLPWLRQNPLGHPTHREVYSRARGLQIYRVLLTRRS